MEHPLTFTSHEVTSGIKKNTTNRLSTAHKAESLMAMSTGQRENLKKNRKNS